VHRLVVIVIVVVAFACGGHTPEPVRNTGNVTAHAGSGSVVATGPAAGSAAIVPEVGCPNPTCAYHPGAAAYFTCLSGGAGACFHFGGPCAPSDGCMFDPQQHAYRPCAKPVEGTCTAWNAGSCAPASGCMFDPDDGLHHHCDQLGNGACAKYGALCAP
jgi:hypothetical protein